MSSTALLAPHSLRDMERNNPDPLFDSDEAAAYLNVKVSFVRDLVKQKRVTTVKLGALVRIRRSELDRLVREGTRPATRPIRRDRWS